MVFLIDEKLGNLALFDEISLLGITGKQKSQCTPLLQSNQCAIYNNALLLWHRCGQFSVIWFIKVVVLCVGEASLGQEQKEINAIFACECQQRTFKPVQYMFQDPTKINKTTH